MIEARAGSRAIRLFTESLIKHKPPASRIDSVTVRLHPGNPVFRDFQIINSRDLSDEKLVPPDLGICPSCVAEFNDPQNRRFHYPFINCTDCGPRFTIIDKTPYDRENTTMRSFKMCRDCEREYTSVSDRRYHAEPNACPACGPRVLLCGPDGKILERQNEAVFEKARHLLKKGRILAVKGIGGFHIAVNAADRKAVKRLKTRKKRSNKPFAVMADSLETISKHAFLDSKSRELLQSQAAPIVLLKNLYDSRISKNVAPGLSHTGWFLPYTPLHRLFFDSRLKALVMTSANISEEPIQYRNKETLKSLKNIADYFLLHDREIRLQADDSVIKPSAVGHVFIRRSRGFVPVPFDTGIKMPDILATGALLKNTICVTKGNNAYLSQHIGDLENRNAFQYFEKTIKSFIDFYGIRPAAVVSDMHPDCMSTVFSLEFSKKNGIVHVKTQHHFSHMLSVMAEHRHYRRSLGIIMDGTGYGEDGHIWGGEFLSADFHSYRRLGHLSYIKLPGGDLCARQPFRTAISALSGHLTPGQINGLYRGFGSEGFLKMLEKGINSPLSSGAGRLFDAAASILGICHISTYDAEAPMRLEAEAVKHRPESDYGHIMTEEAGLLSVDLLPALYALFKDRKNPKAAANFHLTFASAICDAADRLARREGLKDIILSGGVFQNTVLLELALKKLQKKGFNVLMHENTAANDASICLGQAVHAAAVLQKK